MLNWEPIRPNQIWLILMDGNVCVRVCVCYIEFTVRAPFSVFPLIIQSKLVILVEFNPIYRLWMN